MVLKSEVIREVVQDLVELIKYLFCNFMCVHPLAADDETRGFEELSVELSDMLREH
jgi:hypothetical protein